MAGIFLLNTLIAMMADTYQRYEVNKLRTYQLSFAKMVIYWGELAAPAPFSALSLPYELLLMAARRLSGMHPTNAFKRSRVMAFDDDGSGQSADAAPPERLGARGTTPTWKAPKGRERMTMRNSVKTLIDSDVKKLVSGDELHGQDLEPCSLPEWVAANPLAAYLHTIANIVSEETESAAERALRCAQRCLDGPALYRATSFVLGCPLLRAPGRLRGTAQTRIRHAPRVSSSLLHLPGCTSRCAARCRGWWKRSRRSAARCARRRKRPAGRRTRL